MVLNKSIAKSPLNPKKGTVETMEQSPAREKIVELLIEDHHTKMFHVGVNHILAHVRIKYWIAKGQAEVKQVLRKCNIC